MAEFPLSHGLITSSLWACDEATLRVWIALLALSDGGRALVSKKGLAWQARVSETQLKTALERLSLASDQSDTEWIERIEGGWKLHGVERYRELQESSIPARKLSKRAEYMRVFMQKRRAKERAAKMKI